MPPPRSSGRSWAYGDALSGRGTGLRSRRGVGGSGLMRRLHVSRAASRVSREETGVRCILIFVVVRFSSNSIKNLTVTSQRSKRMWRHIRDTRYRCAQRVRPTAVRRERFLTKKHKISRLTQDLGSAACQPSSRSISLTSTPTQWAPCCNAPLLARGCVGSMAMCDRPTGHAVVVCTALFYVIHALARNSNLLMIGSLPCSQLHVFVLSCPPGLRGHNALNDMQMPSVLSHRALSSSPRAVPRHDCFQQKVVRHVATGSRRSRIRSWGFSVWH